MEFSVVERFGLYRVEVWISVLLLVVPWVLYGKEYPIQLIQELDHCPELGCDFVRHYLPQAESARFRLPEMDNGWFYPPLLAIVLIPFTFSKNAALLWTIVNVCGVIVLIRLIRTRDTMVPIVFTVALCSTSLPILHAIKWGQVSIWLTLLLCMSLFPSGIEVSELSVSESDKEGDERKWPAWLLGLAASIKIYPMVFLLIPLLQKRIAWVLHCVLAMMILGIFLPWLWLGADMWQYLYAIQRGQLAVYDMGTIAGGQALSPTLHRWFVSGEFIGVSGNGVWSATALILEAAWLKPTLMMGLVALLVKVVWSLRSNRMDIAKIFILLIAIHLLLQPGWVHYFCWLPLAQVWCWYRAKRKPKALWALGLAIMLERLPLVFLDKSIYFTSSRAGWMTIVLLLTLAVLFYLSRTDEGYSNA